jgi:hypothetical protein
MELERTSLASQSERRGDGVNRLRPSRASTGATRDSTSSRALTPFLVAEQLLIIVAVGVTGYAVAASDDILAAIGLAGIALTAMAIGLGARASMRRLALRCEALGRARAEIEFARYELEVENAELERRNADLEAEHAAIVDGFDWIDERSAGRLRKLLEAAGLEVADLVDMVLDDTDEDG